MFFVVKNEIGEYWLKVIRVYWCILGICFVCVFLGWFFKFLMWYFIGDCLVVLIWVSFCLFFKVLIRLKVFFVFCFMFCLVFLLLVLGLVNGLMIYSLWILWVRESKFLVVLICLIVSIWFWGVRVRYCRYMKFVMVVFIVRLLMVVEELEVLVGICWVVVCIMLW